MQFLGFILSFYLLGVVIFFGTFCVQLSTDSSIKSTEDQLKVVIDAVKKSLAWPKIVYDTIKNRN